MAGKLRQRTDLWGYLFILPFFVVFIIFSLYPIIYSFMLSFKTWDGFRPMSDAGMGNWKRLFTDGNILLSLFNTLVIWLVDFIPQIFVALLLAMIFSQMKIRGMKAFRMIYYLPNLITAASMGLLFNLLFDGRNSTFNQILVALGAGGAPYDFFDSAIFTRLISSYILWWMWFGYTTIILMAGISSIDPELYEAAYIDGAGKRQVFMKITMPLIKETMIYLTITSIIGGMQIFDVPANLTNVYGDPQKAILTSSMYIYVQAFKNFSFGYASAASVLQFIIIAVLSFTTLRFMQRGRK